MAISYYKDKYGRSFTPGQGLPTISTELDSVRAYQFEIHFFNLPGDITGLNQNDLTLAAKKITGIEMNSEAIVIDRVNDKVHYPGKVTPGDLVVTFDNLYLRETASDLWRYFKHTYDPITGEMTKSAQPGGTAGVTFKADKVEIEIQEQTDPEAACQYMTVVSYQPEGLLSKEIITLVLTDTKPFIKKTIDLGNQIKRKEEAVEVPKTKPFKLTPNR